MSDSSKGNPLVFFGIGIFFAAIPLFFLTLFNPTNTQLEKAYKYYEEGEKATTIAERADAFNQALGIYKDLESKNQPIYGNGKLYYNIGNCYYQLEQYAMGVFYYYQAQALMPRSEKVQLNLQQALAKLGVSNPQLETIYDRIFFFHHWLSFPEQMQLFTLLGVLSIGLCSLYIWMNWNWLKPLMIIICFLWLVMTITVVYTRYISSVEGVVLRSSSLYRDAGFQYAKVKEEPILAGSKLEVVGLSQNGKWVKVLTSEGTLGYLPAETFRLIQL